MGRNCSNCKHEYYEGINPCDECSFSADAPPSNWELGGSVIAKQLLEALQAVEWSFHYSGDDRGYCPICTATQEEGHTADCQLAAALKAAGVE